MTKKSPDEESDGDPAAWDRFQHAVDVALHTPATHRKPKDKPESSQRKTALAMPPKPHNPSVVKEKRDDTNGRADRRNN